MRVNGNKKEEKVMEGKQRRRWWQWRPWGWWRW